MVVENLELHESVLHLPLVIDRKALQRMAGVVETIFKEERRRQIRKSKMALGKKLRKILNEVTQKKLNTVNKEVLGKKNDRKS